jgi:NAD(P)-dependent dehydrogenase (short-subunit alcohol dehydrogenase family)
MSSTTKHHVLITGANRGIGYCILKRLVIAFPHHHYLVGARDEAAGQKAIEELRSGGILIAQHSLTVLELDVASTDSIAAAAEIIHRDFEARLDVLVNNAGIAILHEPGSSDLNVLQETWSKTFLVNVFAPHMVFQAFRPFLLKSDEPCIINISSGRASLSRSSTGKLPPTGSILYSVSKVALNGVSVEMDKVLAEMTDGKGRVWSANPGHCKTAFNNYRGSRDPLDGAGVVEVLLRADESGSPVESGFWEEDKGQLTKVPW